MLREKHLIGFSLLNKFIFTGILFDKIFVLEDKISWLV